MSKFSYLIISLSIALALFGAYFLLGKDYLSSNPNDVICTADAMMCPDGTYVGRSGPHCEFVCPTTSTSSLQSVGFLTGRITTSPTCPVERIPPEPECAPRGYATGIIIESANYTKQINSGANGYFYTQLFVGNYNLKPVSANILPRCNEVDGVIIKSNSTTTVTIDCDSGIR